MVPSADDAMPAVAGNVWTWCHEDGEEKATGVCVAPRPPFRTETMVQNQFKEDLTCPICKDLLVQAVFLTPCGHTFCQDCIKNANQNDDRRLCPTCQELMKDEAPNLHARNMVASLQFVCRYRLSYNKTSEVYEVIQSVEDGEDAHCDAKLKGEEVVEHESACECAVQPCKWWAEGCGLVGRRGEAALWEHEATCTFQQSACVFCQANVPLGEKETHLEKECAEVTDKCTNAKYGCKFTPKRSALPQHLAEECLHEKVRADFEAMAKNMDEMQGDLGVLKYETLTEAVTNKDLQVKYAELEEAVQTKDAKIQKLKDELNGLRNTLTQRKEEIASLRLQLTTRGFPPPRGSMAFAQPGAPVPGIKKQKKKLQEKKAVNLSDGPGSGADVTSSKKAMEEGTVADGAIKESGPKAKESPAQKKAGAQSGQKRPREEKQGKQGQAEGAPAAAKLAKKICKFFPSCKMPNCRFLHVDGGASKADASEKRQVERPPAGSKPAKKALGSVCKFYPACYNANCPFLHIPAAGPAKGMDMAFSHGRPAPRGKQGGRPGPRHPSSLPHQGPAMRNSPRPMFPPQGHHEAFPMRFESLGGGPGGAPGEGPPGFRFGDPVPFFEGSGSGAGGPLYGGGHPPQMFSFGATGGGHPGGGGGQAFPMFPGHETTTLRLPSEDVVKNIRDLAVSFVTEQQQQQRSRQTAPMMGGGSNEAFRGEHQSEAHGAGAGGFGFGDRKTSWDLNL